MCVAYSERAKFTLCDKCRTTATAISHNEAQSTRQSGVPVGILMEKLRSKGPPKIGGGGRMQSLSRPSSSRTQRPLFLGSGGSVSNQEGPNLDRGVGGRLLREGETLDRGCEGSKLHEDSYSVPNATGYTGLGTELGVPNATPQNVIGLDQAPQVEVGSIMQTATENVSGVNDSTNATAMQPAGETQSSVSSCCGDAVSLHNNERQDIHVLTTGDNVVVNLATHSCGSEPVTVVDGIADNVGAVTDEISPTLVDVTVAEGEVEGKAGNSQSKDSSNIRTVSRYPGNRLKLGDHSISGYGMANRVTQMAGTSVRQNVVQQLRKTICYDPRPLFYPEDNRGIGFTSSITVNDQIATNLRSSEYSDYWNMWCPITHPQMAITVSMGKTVGTLGNELVENFMTDLRNYNAKLIAGGIHGHTYMPFNDAQAAAAYMAESTELLDNTGLYAKGFTLMFLKTTIGVWNRQVPNAQYVPHWNPVGNEYHTRSLDGGGNMIAGLEWDIKNRAFVLLAADFPAEQRNCLMHIARTGFPMHDMNGQNPRINKIHWFPIQISVYFRGIPPVEAMHDFTPDEMRATLFQLSVVRREQTYLCLGFNKAVIYSFQKRWTYATSTMGGRQEPVPERYDDYPIDQPIVPAYRDFAIQSDEVPVTTAPAAPTTTASGAIPRTTASQVVTTTTGSTSRAGGRSTQSITTTAGTSGAQTNTTNSVITTPVVSRANTDPLLRNQGVDEPVQQPLGFMGALRNAINRVSARASRNPYEAAELEGAIGGSALSSGENSVYGSAEDINAVVESEVQAGRLTSMEGQLVGMVATLTTNLDVATRDGASMRNAINQLTAEVEVLRARPEEPVPAPPSVAQIDPRPGSRGRVLSVTQAGLIEYYLCTGERAVTARLPAPSSHNVLWDWLSAYKAAPDFELWSGEYTALSTATARELYILGAASAQLFSFGVGSAFHSNSVTGNVVNAMAGRAALTVANVYSFGQQLFDGGRAENIPPIYKIAAAEIAAVSEFMVNPVIFSQSYWCEKFEGVVITQHTAWNRAWANRVPYIFEPLSCSWLLHTWPYNWCIFQHSVTMDLVQEITFDGPDAGWYSDRGCGDYRSITTDCSKSAPWQFNNYALTVVNGLCQNKRRARVFHMCTRRWSRAFNKDDSATIGGDVVLRAADYDADLNILVPGCMVHYSWLDDATYAPFITRTNFTIPIWSLLRNDYLKDGWGVGCLASDMQPVTTDVCGDFDLFAGYSQDKGAPQTGDKMGGPHDKLPTAAEKAGEKGN